MQILVETIEDGGHDAPIRMDFHGRSIRVAEIIDLCQNSFDRRHYHHFIREYGRHPSRGALDAAVVARQKRK